MKKLTTLQIYNTAALEPLGYYKIYNFYKIQGSLELKQNKILSSPWIHPLKFSALLRQKHAKMLNKS